MFSRETQETSLIGKTDPTGERVEMVSIGVEWEVPVYIYGRDRTSKTSVLSNENGDLYRGTQMEKIPCPTT